jgi:hypothetical protein
VVGTLHAITEAIKSADFYQRAADAIGIQLYLYADGSVTNYRKVGIEPAAMIEPRESCKPTDDHGLGDQVRPS